MAQRRLLHFIICKLYCSEIQENARIELTIRKGDELHYSSVAIFKNGWANFYRQPFELNGQIQDFYLEITEIQTRLVQAQLLIPSSLLSKVDFRNNCFQTCGNGYRLEWQAKIVIEADNLDYQATDREQDFHDFCDASNERNSCLINLQPAKNIRNKRKRSMHVRKDSDLISEPTSLNQKFAQLTNDTFILKKHSQETQIEKNYFPIRKLEKIKQGRKKILGQKKQSIDFTRKKALDLAKSCEKVNESKLKTNNEVKRFLSPQLQRSKSPKLKRCLSGGLSSINFRGLISTAVVGILSGIAAAHI